ncbi:MAG: Na+/H+ antiporter NhaA [Pirellulaceae bacterium]
MSHEHKSRTPAPIRFLFENSVFLIAGALAALVWANVDPGPQGSYQRFVNYDLAHIPFDLGLMEAPADQHGANQHGANQHDANQHDADQHDAEQHGENDDASHAADGEHGDEGAADATDKAGTEQDEHEGGHAHSLTMIVVLVNDILMALFFAIAGKEVWEALLPGGALSNPRKAAVPLLATAGGIVGPAGLYILGALILGKWGDYGGGWAIPCATDIAFSYLVARIIFGNGHPAIAFLLLLAIADDAAGLVILAVFYPNPAQPLNPWWLLLSVAAILLGFGMRKMRLHSFWWYLLIPGTMSWIAFHQAGIHAALGLVPIIPTLPHAHTDLGIFARDELKRHDTLNEFEHWWKYPVEIILGLFGLVNAGVAFSNVGVGTALVVVGLLVGKPLGIMVFTLFSDKVLKLNLPAGMNYRDVLSLGMVAGIGFTVALFVSTAAFPEPGPIQDQVKMGALASFFAAVVAYVGARALGVRPLKPEPPVVEESESAETEMANA